MDELSSDMKLEMRLSLEKLRDVHRGDIHSSQVQGDQVVMAVLRMYQASDQSVLNFIPQLKAVVRLCGFEC